MPLLSPTMEKELLTETWNIPELSNLNTMEESTIHTIWEEDYQDLSDWCIDTFRSQCVFHTGESTAMIHSGMKTGGISMLTDIVGDVIDSRGIDNDSSTTITMKKTLAHSNNQSTILSVDYKKENTGGEIDIPDAFLDLPQSSIAVRTDEWVQLIDNQNTNESVEQITNFENNNTDTVDNRQENWDVINTSSNAFDLLSYLCDDNVRSPESVATEDLTGGMQNKTIIQSSTQPSKITTKLRSRRRVKIDDDKSQIITSSPVTSSVKTEHDVELPTSSTTRHLKAVATKKRIEISPIIPRGRKRRINSDSDDESSNYSYKESREKNNEASRKSRMNKKSKEKEMLSQADRLERDNTVLRVKVEQLDKMVTSLRAAILQSALKKKS